MTLMRIDELREIEALYEGAHGRLLGGWLHELRNPLNAVINGVGVLRERGDSLALRDKLLGTVLDSAQKMAHRLTAIEGYRPGTHDGVSADWAQQLREAIALLSFRLRSVEFHPAGVTGQVGVSVQPAPLWRLTLLLLEAATRPWLAEDEVGNSEASAVSLRRAAPKTRCTPPLLSLQLTTSETRISLSIQSLAIDRIASQELVLFRKFVSFLGGELETRSSGSKSGTGLCASLPKTTVEM